MVAQLDSEITLLAQRMASQTVYEDAWMIGLEIQAFGEAAITAYQHVLKHGTVAARRATAFWLSDEAENIPPAIFLDLSTDPDNDIRYYAAYGLGYVQHEQAVHRLRELMLNDPSAEVRQTAAHSLYPAAHLNEAIHQIIADFANALHQEPADVVREEIVTSLSYFLGTDVIHKAIKLLVETALQDKSPSVVEQAQISLSILRNEQWRDKQLVV
jgi:HEAT repeat protein